MDELGLWERWKSKTPRFFKNVQKFGASLVVLSTGLLAVPGLHEIAVKFAGFIATAGGVMAAVAQFACTNTSSETPEPTDNP